MRRLLQSPRWILWCLLLLAAGGTQRLIQHRQMRTRWLETATPMPQQQDLAPVPAPQPLAVNPSWAGIRVAEYTLDATVLGRERYWLDDLAAVVPVDLALAWGETARADIATSLRVHQAGRWFLVGRGEPLPSMETMANVHPVPASSGIRRQLLSLRPGDRIRVVGALVDLVSPDGARYPTSRRRDDVGAGACETLLVERLEVLTPPAR